MDPAIAHRAPLRALTSLLVGLALATAIFAVGAAAARAQATTDAQPQVRFAVGSAPMALAQQIAIAHWGTNPCGGQIAISWGDEAPAINAVSNWTNPVGAYDDPSANGSCSIVLNPKQSFDWPKFCTVLVHEYGHLAGRAHSADGPDVMSPFYRAPLPACAAAAEPGAPVATASQIAPRATRRGRAARASAGSRA